MNEIQSDNNTSPSQEDKSRWHDFLKIYLVVAVLFLVMFTMRSTITMLQIYVPKMVETFEETKGTITFMFTIYNLTAAVISFFAGPITKKVGYKVMIFTGMGIFATATGLSAFATEYWMIAVCQSAAGFGAALFGPANIAYAGDYFDEKRKATAIGLIMSSFYISSIITAPINSIIADEISWRWGLGLMAIIALITFILILLLLPRIKGGNKSDDNTENDQNPKVESELPVSRTEDTSYVLSLKNVLSNKYAVGTFFITLFQRGGLFAMTALLSTWLKDTFELSTTETGYFFLGAGVAALISNTLFSWLSNKIGKRIIIIVGTSLTGIWIGIFPLISTTVTMAVISIIILNFFGAMSMGSYNTFITEVSPNNKGTAVAINNTFGQLSQAGVVFLFGKIIYDLTDNQYSYKYCGFAAMGIFLICIILMLIFVRPKKIEEHNASLIRG
ncbi:MAG: MFS transporter [Candidatus Heimdallarchaeota archaeon]